MGHRAVAIAAFIAVGVGALALIPNGMQPTVATAEAEQPKVSVSSISSPNPALLRRLDAEVAPPPVVAERAAPAPVKVALADATVSDLATDTLPAAPMPDPALKPARIGSSAVNLRAGPSSSAQQISVLQPGEAIQVGETSRGWVKVTRADGSTGWVYSTYIAGNAASAPAADDHPSRVASTAQPRAVIRGGKGDLEDRTARIASRLPAYARPSNGAQSVFTLQPGDEVYIAEVRGSWIRVETDDGLTAWIRR
jgi:SH3-like domain-containing protein